MEYATGMRRTLIGSVIFAGLAAAQSKDVAEWTATRMNEYVMNPNLTYSVANGKENKLDIYRRREDPRPSPVLIYIHGGGWTGGTKEQSSFAFLPYLDWGFSVVNVEYRLANVSLAPAAVEDCRCALKWVIRNAKQYNFDASKIAVTGGSAGGHLALTTGMLLPSDGFDNLCPDEVEPKVAAIVNWYGITDVQDLLDGKNKKLYAVNWLGGLLDRPDVARRVSPLWHVRQGLPPVLTIHGDADPTVPYTHGVRLHQALQKLDVPSQLLTIPGGKHGGFTREENIKIFAAIREFLAKNGLMP